MHAKVTGNVALDRKSMEKGRRRKGRLNGKRNCNMIITRNYSAIDKYIAEIMHVKVNNNK